MVVLSYMLATARVNGKTVWCLKNDLDISSTSSYDFSWNLAKVLALSHVQRWSLNGLASSVQLKINMFLGTALLIDESVTKLERRFTETEIKEKMSITPGQLPHKDRKGQCLKINWTVPIMWYHYWPGAFNVSLPWLLTMKLCFIFHIHCA